MSGLNMKDTVNAVEVGAASVAVGSAILGMTPIPGAQVLEVIGIASGLLAVGIRCIKLGIEAYDSYQAHKQQAPARSSSSMFAAPKEVSSVAKEANKVQAMEDVLKNIDSDLVLSQAGKHTPSAA